MEGPDGPENLLGGCGAAGPRAATLSILSQGRREDPEDRGSACVCWLLAVGSLFVWAGKLTSSSSGSSRWVRAHS